MIALTYEQVRAMDPCEDGLAEASTLLGWPSDRAVSVRDAIEAGVSLSDVSGVLVALKDPDVDRRLRLFAADCAARVLPVYERKHDNPTPRNAIIVARRFARGEATEDELAAAGDAARDAETAARSARSARVAAWAVARASWGAGAAAWAAAAAATAAAVEDAAWAAAWASRGSLNAETAWQRTRLIERFEGEPEDWPLEEVR